MNQTNHDHNMFQRTHLERSKGSSSYLATLLHGNTSISAVCIRPLKFATMGASPIPLVAVLFALLAVVLVQGSISLLKVNESTGKCVGYQIVTSSGISIIVAATIFPVRRTHCAFPCVLCLPSCVCPFSAQYPRAVMLWQNTIGIPV